jgi:cytochrome c oxidase assembly factor CtaG
VTPPEPYSFTFEPLFLVLGAAGVVLYARAARGQAVARWRVAIFALGVLLIVGAVNSPLETLAAHYLLVVHLLQNVMVADWAPPLLVLGLTLAMRAAVARRGGRAFTWLTRPKIALAVWLVGWYGIHFAGFYDFALRNPWALNVEHALLIVIGLLFWWPVFSASPHELASLVKVAYLFAGFLGASFLGHALLFSSTPFYDYYTEVPRLWGLSASEDQTYGGLLMNVEQSLVFLAAVAYFLVRLVQEEQEHEGELPPGRQNQTGEH